MDTDPSGTMYEAILDDGTRLMSRSCGYQDERMTR